MKLKAFVIGILVVGVYPFIAHWISPDSQSGEYPCGPSSNELL